MTRRHARAASASFHYAHAARWTRQRAAAQLRRYAMRTGAVLGTLLCMLNTASAETWILPADTEWKPELTTFSRVANDVESAFHRAAAEEGREVPEWFGYTIQYSGTFSDEGVRLVAVVGRCAAAAKTTAEHFDLTKVFVGTADGGTCIFSALYDADQQVLRHFFFHGEA